MNQYQITTLGRFDVLKNGKSLIKSASGAKKIWELYKFILSYKEKDFTPESIMDNLWVGQEYSDPRSTLRRQMHRLRQVLGEDKSESQDATILFTNGYYTWNRQLLINLDAEEFVRCVENGDYNVSSSPEEALSNYMKAIDLYVGDYLPECMDQHWIFSIRNQYRRYYSKAVSQAVMLLKMTESYENIIKVCSKAIQVDPYEESFQLTYMESLMAAGEHRQAIEHYGYITNFYAQEMGLKPSIEMRQLYKRMLSFQQTLDSDDSLYAVLESETVIENAFYCEYDVFKSIYELERRRSERSGQEFSIGIIEIPKNRESYSKTEARMSQLKQHLMVSLRKGDTLARWSQSQFVVLLPGVDKDLMELVLTRTLAKDEVFKSVVVSQITHLKAEPRPCYKGT